MPEYTSMRSWRSRLRLNVRGLMVLTLLLGGVLGWWHHQVRKRQQVVAGLGRLGPRIFMCAIVFS